MTLAKRKASTVIRRSHNITARIISATARYHHVLPSDDPGAYGCADAELPTAVTHDPEDRSSTDLKDLDLCDLTIKPEARTMRAG